MEPLPEKKLHIFSYHQVPHHLVIIFALCALWYLSWWFDFSRARVTTLFILLFIGEIYHVWQTLGYMHTIWNERLIKPKVLTETPPVDVFITVCGEPVQVVEKTLQAALSLNYPNFTVYLLNDSYVAKKDNWQEIEMLAHTYLSVKVITRRIPGGAKAGNVNHALRMTTAPFFAIFDADHVPRPDFLRALIPYATDDPRMALVQSPQHYINKNENYLTGAAWQQQELFFGPICQGKNHLNATFWCGTNAIVRREAIQEIGGVPEENIAEDFLASLFLHEKGWKSIFYPEILADGLAPTELASYFNQQYRWARGSLEVIFKYNPLFRRGLTWAQKFQYLYSAGYYLSGLIIIVDAVIPLIVLFSGTMPVIDSIGNFMIYFFPFIFTTLYLLLRSTNYTITFRAVQLSMSSFFIYVLAAVATITGKKSPFKVTAKTTVEGNYLKYAAPNIIYSLLAVAAIVYGLYLNGPTPAVITNASWAVFNIVFFFSFIRVGYPWHRLWISRSRPSESIYRRFPAAIATYLNRALFKHEKII